MSRISIETHGPDDFFSHQALELAFRLLRNNNPGLANAIQNTLSHLHIVPFETLQGSHTGEMYFNAEIYQTLSAHTIGKIVSALTEIGEQALAKQDMPPGHLNQLRKLIQDWVQLTEWVLSYTTIPDKAAFH
ncbi:MAG: hypothetical protein EOO53_16815 [Gammaproteobacteria bacterium]|nr:MAG: hypothetical protein EOO53_16815 [Gammaproteobacteria bacterium]